ncbi:tRNA (adenosine(37)-N6)-dimethylallyltransferase MiaA [Roseivirga sp. E12]|uniref:tRNA (adenosine(37)-N6)-dimethylallyltransferase MiaA n=1 Tax=Roseivirga sp. E12 TaxID=2819237 RepID=UPI001ABCA607|nr:tRNA (adenosine(37)-N6)-dimethylallyltransferase MiaA [Roseivirga sp. E12]MBO3697997.1 tRNA (adenosine(37)-N6)-dimethylallyltransferase MiaA [Roseivirga sp. E12]
MLKKHLICVVGPTAVGKTAIGIKLAQALQTEIVSADSRQFYRELQIGTAKPDSSELNQVPHHCINSLSIHDNYDVGRYEKEALAKLDELFQHHGQVVLVGGSGLFVDAVCLGLDDLPRVKNGVREGLNSELETKGLDVLVDELKQSDPEYYEIVDRKNPQRVIRALEVIRSTDKPFSSFRKRTPKQRPFEVISVGLELDRGILYRRIDERMDVMIANGLFKEAEGFLPFKELNALQTVGYTEIFGYLEGSYDKEEAIRLLKRNSRRYAKRQLTWFKRNECTEWFNPSNFENIHTYVKNELELSKSKD